MSKRARQFVYELRSQVGGVWFVTIPDTVVGACNGIPFVFLGPAYRPEVPAQCVENGVWVLSEQDIEKAVGLVKAKTGRG